MTQDSYNNYIGNIAYMQGLLASDVVNLLKVGQCKNCKGVKDLIISEAFLEVLSDFTLYPTPVPQTRTVTGTRTIYLLTQYLSVPNTQADSNQFDVGDAVVITDGLGTTWNDIIQSKLTVGANYYYELQTSILAGVTYTMSKTETTNDQNFLTIDEMKGIVNTLNKIYETNYCLDFVLTTP